MKLFKYFIPSLLVNIISAQNCIVGDCIDGYGEKKWKSSLYKGNFKGGRMFGYGEYTWTNGESYIGTFREDFFEGNGVRKYKSGAVYEGGFKYDKRHGKGKIKYSTGSSYSGNWRFGFWNGIGLYKDGKGYSHEGNYNFNKKDGFGKQKWSNGDVYEGNFKNDYREGYGIYKWISGEIYSGNWKNGKKHGFGISEKNDQILKKGIWYNGVYTSNETGCIEIGQECLKNRLCCKIKYENSEILFFGSRKTMVPVEKLPTYLKTYPNAKKRYFYDEEWNVVDEFNSSYYREISDYDSANKTYLVRDYFSKTDKPQFEGRSKSNNPYATNNETMVLDGQCFWYKEDGSIDYEVNFLEGREHGKTIFYLKNGETIVLNYDRGLMLNKE